MLNADLHDRRAGLRRQQTGLLRQMPLLPSGASVARIHGPLELRLQVVLHDSWLRLHDAGRLRLLGAARHNDAIRKANLARTADSAAGRRGRLSTAAAEVNLAIHH